MTVKVSIKTDARLADCLSDFLIGTLNGVVEFGVDDKTTVTVVHCFFEPENSSPEHLKVIDQQVADYAAEMAKIFGLPTPECTSEIVVDQDWSTSWKEHFKPFSITSGLVIAPSWEDYQAKEGERVIVMDPGMAFGTGHHATTRLCIEMIMRARQLGAVGRLLDVGTGTGILAMAAVLFGVSTAEAIDNDQDAVAIAAKNVALNGLKNIIAVSSRSIAEVETTYQIVVANIVHDILYALADDLSRVTAPGGYLILSGLIHGEQTRHLISCFSGRNFELIQEKQDGEWGALLLLKQ